MNNKKVIFYRTQEAADLLCISKQSLFNQIAINKQNCDRYPLPPYKKIGRRVLFPVSDFHEWLESQPRF